MVMFVNAVAIVICLVILGAWFLLQIGVAEVFLVLFLLVATGVGTYWLCTAGRVSDSVEAVGIFALIVIILGSIRLGIGKLNDMMATLLPPSVGTKDRGRSHDRHPL
jgi:hypothetical protein